MIDCATKDEWAARCFGVEERLAEAQARIAKIEDERDAWIQTVGKIAATIPLKDTIGATGTIGDMIEYFKKTMKDKP
jgi:hypothetical protein